jgi:hypothetical protein
MGHKPYLGAILEKDARVLEFAPPQLTIALPEGGLRSPQEILPVLKEELEGLTQQRWAITLAPYTAAAATASTLKEEKSRAYQEKLVKIAQEPDVKEILRAFPGAKITQVVEKDL